MCLLSCLFMSSKGISEGSLERLLILCVFSFIFFLSMVFAGERSQFVHAEFNYKSYLDKII